LGAQEELGVALSPPFEGPSVTHFSLGVGGTVGRTSSLARLERPANPFDRLAVDRLLIDRPFDLTAAFK
jgi:hypothetical protein